MEKTRNCPTCNRPINYESIQGFNHAKKINSSCRSCVNQITQNCHKESEFEFLVENYTKLGPKKCAEILNRTQAATRLMASQRNIKYNEPKDKINNKICSKCKKEKNKSKFGKNKARKGELTVYCKICLENIRNSSKVKRQKYEYDKIYRKEKLKTDINYKLRLVLRGRVINAIKSQDTSKRYKTFDLIGCSVEEFKLYLESKFTQGMTWKNYGNKGWHIDHIKPCITFDLTKEEGQRVCFHYTNMQPLWATTKIAIKYGESEDYIGNLNKWKN